jgi:hypothetical protein
MHKIFGYILMTEDEYNEIVKERNFSVCKLESEVARLMSLAEKLTAKIETMYEIDEANVVLKYKIELIELIMSEAPELKVNNWWQLYPIFIERLNLHLKQAQDVRDLNNPK